MNREDTWNMRLISKKGNTKEKKEQKLSMKEVVMLK